MTQSEQTVRYTLADLVYLMQRLRNPVSGCPWDLKQTCESIVSSTLEEVYEVVEAIERGDTENLREELGDLLFQVVFYSQMASEARWFDFDEVAHHIVAKLVRRHPHVFPTGNLREEDPGRKVLDDETLHAQWEAIKQQEKQRKSSRSGAVGVLADVPSALPALQRALKIQKKLATVGFDWGSAAELLPVVEGELAEVREALVSGDRAHLQEELGDVLFAVVNLCRHLDVDPETVLRGANRKVQNRFAQVEQGLSQQGKAPEQATLEEMEALWQAAKQREL